ncbi:hypothetical protein [Lysobacter firmicutimachus]|uniref:Uncharacterized protein n=1 Tax=Lysobacter firmicutimachus TaxID=1792846 RepID=A0ABU8D245_9GAMM
MADAPNIGQFAGIVLSPVNDSPEEIVVRLKALTEKQSDLDVILDPQLYNPVTQKGQLPRWAYYGSDFETADRSLFGWWARKIPEIAAEAVRVGATTVCSPTPIPRVMEDNYFRFVVDLADEMIGHVRPLGLDAALSLIIPLNQLHEPRRAMEIASTVSGSKCDRVFISFLADCVPQREPMRDQAALATAIHLIRLLSSQQRVHVACASHDVLLWLGAGAHDVSTGKYMNLRRFSPSRWTDEQTKGRNLSYWNDEKLLTLIRDQEALRLDREGWFNDSHFADNPASGMILETLRQGEGAPWLKLSWVQYMRWFANIAATVRTPDQTLEILAAAHRAWGRINDMEFLFVDSFNDGSHVIAWLNAMREGMRR